MSIWIPTRLAVPILTPGDSPRVARLGDALDGGELLPGLRVPLDKIFD